MSRIRQLAEFDFYNKSEADGKVVEAEMLEPIV
jgi:hypothetical protein